MLIGRVEIQEAADFWRCEDGASDGSFRSWEGESLVFRD